MIKTLNIDGIEMIQTRVATSDAIVEQYVEAKKAGAKFPPIKVFTDGKNSWCSDGHHRMIADTRLGKKKIECDVTKGTRADALKCALGANETHGFRRTNDDKRLCAETALKEFCVPWNPKGKDLSDRLIAQICNVSNTFVGQVRQALPIPEPPPEPVTPEPTVNVDSPAEKPKSKLLPKSAVKRVGKDGKERQVKLSPKPAPAPKKETDETGVEIPSGLKKLWENRADADDLVGNLSDTIRSLKQAQQQGKKLFVHVDFTSVLASLNQSREDLKQAIPYAVCPDCNGKEVGSCSLCKSSGFVSEFIWKTCVPDEKKIGRK